MRIRPAGALFQRLERGSDLSFSCRIAALIRGKSVYCVPIEIEFVDSREAARFNFPEIVPQNGAQR